MSLVVMRDPFFNLYSDERLEMMAISEQVDLYSY